MAVIQSLKLAPERLEVVGVDMDPLAVGFRRLSIHELVPSAESVDYVDRIISLSRKHHVDVVFPTVDEEVEVLAEHSDLFKEAGIALPIPSASVVRTARDKYAISSRETIGIECPKTALPHSLKEVDEALEFVGTPCIMKPRFGRGGRGFAAVNSAEDAHYWFSKSEDEVILQERIDGYLLMVQAIAQKGMVLASIVQRRLATKVENSGTATSAVTVDDAESVRKLTGVLAKLGWHGAVAAEFMVRDKERFLIDLNPRIAGQSHLSTLSGMNLAYGVVELAVKGRLSIGTTYERGKMFLRVWEDEVFDAKELDQAVR